MAKYNREALLRSLAQYRQSIDHLISQIEQENWDALEQQLKQTQQARLQFLPESRSTKDIALNIND
jgi:arogenate dehydrogenase (NADP+)